MYCPETLEDAHHMLQEAQKQGQVSTSTQFLMTGIEDDGMEDHDMSWQFMRDQRSVQHWHGTIPTSWILLDSQHSVDIFVNHQLLCNIHHASHYMHICTTAGVACTNLIGNVPGYGTVWFHPDRITNILLSKVKAHYTVTYDSSNGKCICCSQAQWPELNI